MKRILFYAVILLAGYRLTAAEPITYYCELTDNEVTVFGERIWFTTPDTVWGPLRSNDFLYIKYSPTFFDHVISTGDRFIYQNPNHNPYFEYPPTFNAAPYRFPRELSYLRDLAQYRIDDDGGRLMTTLQFAGRTVNVNQSTLGDLGPDTLVRRSQVRNVV